MDSQSMPAKSKIIQPIKKARGPLPKVKRSFTALAYYEIRRQILENEMSAGFQITEQDLALRLKMSRTPTREAMLQVASEGLVEIWPRHGMRVKPVSVSDLREIYQIITALEATAAGLAAQRILAAGQIAAMRGCIDEMDAALAADDLRLWADADVRFHASLTEASGNRRLIDTVNTFSGQAHRLRMITLRLRPKPLTSNRDHEEVVNAIEAHDVAAAEQIHRLHRERSGEMLINLLDVHGIPSL
jgi:DNA-binding GntR family transcriptional regulator